MRLAIHADRHAAFAHAAWLWQAERRLHLRIEPWLNGLAAARPALAEAAGYYYGLLHFLVTPLVLAWLYLRRPPAFPRLRSALVLATGANSRSVMEPRSCRESRLNWWLRANATRSVSTSPR